jgi:histidinol-phosphate/aromatic aminotransferase/cobyric acid decarboxylase-like protein
MLEMHQPLSDFIFSVAQICNLPRSELMRFVEEVPPNILLVVDEACIRITVGTEKENERCLAALKMALR